MKKALKIIVPILLVLLIVIIILLNTKRDKKTSTEEGYTDRIPVLTFHRLVSDKVKKEQYPDNQWVGSIDVFDGMMKYLYDNGYQTIGTEEFYEWYIGKKEYGKKTVMITFDDGFYEDYYLVYPVLKKYNFKAISFVVGSRIKDTTLKYDDHITSFLGMDVINKVRKEYPNFEFQSHSYNMHYYTKNKKHRIKTMSYDELLYDTQMNAKYNFISMAYPYGDYNEDIEKILEENGYLVAFRFSPADYATRESDRFAIPRIKITGNHTLDDMIKWVSY